ncbi:hypothetical protein DH2020_013581 [Rehmannia glutinosa]|uniref:Uncharacterized protein n=1 Tax=Rehmannia glutinosa TaxID=99300 RepID=A0ABR0X5T3_REHGL
MAPTIPIDYTGQRESKKFSKRGSGDVMGKTRKVSKGHSTGFVPDYRHAVETVGESEGFGSSGRVDAELTASQDPYAPNRKCIGLNVGGYDRSVVPIQNLSLSKMSPLERQDLSVRLKRELEQVRTLQRKIASFSLDAMTTDGHTYQYGLKGHMMESLPRSTNTELMAPGKKKCPSGRNGPRTKGGNASAGRNESVKQGLPQSSNYVMLMKQCETLLTRLMAHQHGWIFNEPVDVVKHNIPDYFNVIKHPMDLGTVKSKLLSNQYSNPIDFAADVRLTFKNAMTYNPVGHAVHNMADTLSKYFEVRWKPIEKKIAHPADDSTASKSSVIIEPESAYVPPAKKQKTISMENIVKHERNKQAMSDVEKQKLGVELEDLMAELPDSIISFLKESTLNCSQVSEDEIEIDIDALSNDTLFTLRKLLDDYLLEKQKKQTIPEPCKIEVRTESEFNNLSTHPCKDNELADEDVDIGVDDAPPTSSSPPVKIDRDAARRNDKCSSSRSSGSESGSSSTVAYSENKASCTLYAHGFLKFTLLCSLHAIAGDLNGLCLLSSHRVNCSRKLFKRLYLSGCQKRERDIQASPGVMALSVLSQSLIESECCPHSGSSSASELDGPKNSDFACTVNGIADAKVKQKESDVGDPNIGDCLHGNAEQNTVSSPSSIEPHCRQEALLRSRFADIIIKAQENTIEKGDPEKLKLEREELERRRREVYLRVWNWCFDFVKFSLALMMEKTVEINENSQFMEDLEMFRSQDEPLQSFIEAASPENSQNGLGSFKFQASSNPLEQLGLYMKNDEEEEEEEEVEPRSNPGTSNDPEEGEID